MPAAVWDARRNGADGDSASCRISGGEHICIRGTCLNTVFLGPFLELTLFIMKRYLEKRLRCHIIESVRSVTIIKLTPLAEKNLFFKTES